MDVMVSERSSQGGQQFHQVGRGPKSGRGAQRSHKLRHKSGGWRGDLVRGSNYVHALILIGHLRNCIDVEASLALNTSFLHQGSIHPSFLTYITYTRASFWSEVVILRAQRSWYDAIKQ